MKTFQQYMTEGRYSIEVDNSSQVVVNSSSEDSAVTEFAKSKFPNKDLWRIGYDHGVYEYGIGKKNYNTDHQIRVTKI